MHTWESISYYIAFVLCLHLKGKTYSPSYAIPIYACDPDQGILVP